MNKQLPLFNYTPETPAIRDPFDTRYPGLARILYIAYRFGFRSIKRALIERIAEEAASGVLDRFLDLEGNSR